MFLKPTATSAALQVRHPALSIAFQAEFQQWFFKTKNNCKRWKAAKKLADTAIPHLIKLPNPNLTKAVVSNTTSMLAKALGKEMLDVTSDHALNLLLSMCDWACGMLQATKQPYKDIALVVGKAPML